MVQAPAVRRAFDPPAHLQQQNVEVVVTPNTSLQGEIWLTLTTMDSFSFVTSGALEMPVNVKMSVGPHSLLSYSILTNQ